MAEIKNKLIKKAPITIQFYFDNDTPACTLTCEENTKYWSPDFYGHLFGKFIANNPLLENHDHELLIETFKAYLKIKEAEHD